MLYLRKFSMVSQAVALTLVFALLSMNIVGVVANTKNAAGNESVNSPALNKYTTDLTKLAEQGKLRVNPNFETEVNALVKVLAGKGSRYPVVLDEKGESQKLIAEAFAARLAKGDVPESLSGKRLITLETASIFSNTETKEQLSNTIENIISEFSNSKSDTILFVDEL